MFLSLHNNINHLKQLTMKKLMFLFIAVLFIACSKEDKPIVIGSKAEGGIVFYIDEDLGYGFVISEQVVGKARWSPRYGLVEDVYNTFIGDGEINTQNIVNYYGTDTYAAKICYDLVLNGYNDWYLPASIEYGMANYNLGDKMPRLGSEAISNRLWTSNNRQHMGDTRAQTYKAYEPLAGTWDVDKLTELEFMAVRKFKLK